MEIDYPFMELINPEYEYTYVPWHSDGRIEEVSTDEVMDSVNDLSYS